VGTAGRGYGGGSDVAEHSKSGGAEWRLGYAAALEDMKALDAARVEGGEGTTAALAIWVEWMREPARTARLAWRRRLNEWRAA
jgi:hypothetical protein